VKKLGVAIIAATIVGWFGMIWAISGPRVVLLVAGAFGVIGLTATLICTGIYLINKD
jgi:hypothetical protein